MMRKKGAVLAGLAAAMIGSTSAYADTAPPAAKPIAVYLDGQQLQTEVQPLNVGGTVLVPMRGLFERQGAKLAWNNATKTLKATKGATTLIYRIGEHTASLNGQALAVTVPGQISDGYSLVPLRFVSETLGSEVAWQPDARTIRITSKITLETSIRWGVNLRSKPDSSSDATSLGMIPTGQKVHVIREVNALWLEVETENHQTGYISAKPKYTDYASTSLADMQADELIAYGKKFLGTPYEFGASSDQTKTFDCSSFVKRVYEDTLSVELPRVSYDQAKVGKEVPLSDLSKGDLLFFSARGLDIGHVGIYMGNNQILHTYSKELGVHVEAFDSQWKKHFVTARRIL
ncbi:stalk domain-containing protein [Paenibacillus sp. XY044]|uniref:stalk domain-containing protein n=1 Tax=Paenibacillus sp. XY044 TaxID=2026089 RepID=UPI000B99834E|nr:NlpC/P60 family protein [Paenibacillus sp. XY044]OZB93776.1 copper amine oxidase [Paenibacillus sp. XY044]